MPPRLANGGGNAADGEQDPGGHAAGGPKGTNNTAGLNALQPGMLLAQSEVAAGRSAAIFCDSKYPIQPLVSQNRFGYNHAFEKKHVRKSRGG